MRTKLSKRAASSTTAREVRAAETPVELEPEGRQLDADVRAETVLVDRVERAPVGVAQADRLLAERHLLAEDVERRLLAVGVQLADDVACLGKRRPGDVAAREALHDLPRHRGERSDDRAVDDGHGAAILVRHIPRATRVSAGVTLESGWRHGVAPSLVALRTRKCGQEPEPDQNAARRIPLRPNEARIGRAATPPPSPPRARTSRRSASRAG